ncbi:site-specific integrase [Enterococcus sp. BWB1-3]|uniref:tyrosine-type recombinase/integrase n=1 Tax=Enterococcus sp. BWB1-3 TaxID=2787713 RepID=UPI001920C9B1|nr:site-specific integrase [Enterococcus sp. BWB1-3]MBL1228165.1 site-specific integrase [Enterococcus sp. BWB1-3]
MEWAEVYRKPFVQEVTWKKYENTHQKIQAQFKQATVDQITRKNVQVFLNVLSKKYGKLTVKTILQQMKACSQSLLEDGEIKRDFTSGVRFSGIEKPKKKKYLEVSDAKKLIAQLVLERPCDLMILVALKTGMRFAEILGLTTADVFESAIHVNKTFDYKYTKKFKTTKTKTSIRNISVDENTIDAIKHYTFLNNITENKMIFPDSIYSMQINRRLKRLCESLDIPTISFHGLRHTHGSLLLMQGIPMISVSKRLGHASLSITQDVYIHLMQEQEEKDNETIIALMEAI